MIVLEVGNLNGLVIFMLFVMLGPPIVLTLIGFGIKKNSPNSAKTLFILAALYLIIGLGICGSLLSN
jgi:hypothetical protein